MYIHVHKRFPTRILSDNKGIIDQFTLGSEIKNKRQ